MCVDCVLTSSRIAQADPGQRTPPRGRSVTSGSSILHSPPTAQPPAPHAPPSHIRCHPTK
jgi:hypothetical protein